MADAGDRQAGAILKGANSPGDSDSIASMVGAVVGARCGLASLPGNWVRDVWLSAEMLDLARAIAAVASS
ncbi:MAG: ADP-ribosylglycohydrolase family protein [Proteobacteria bacterium]|nr:ADP-ribosylglycohydrolase family protein [Pseudomonadota bacterium]